MTAKVTKSKNIFSGKNAKIIPAPKRSHHKKIVNPRHISGTGCKPPEGVLAFKDVAYCKPATILYKKLPDDMILITGFENFLSVVELEKKYGEVIADTYTKYPDKMVKVFDTFGVVRVHFGYNDTVCIGDVFPKKAYCGFVQRVRKCGGLLHDIIQAVNGGEVKRIEI
jgi:hypothetical protein